MRDWLAGGGFLRKRTTTYSWMRSWSGDAPQVTTASFTPASTLGVGTGLGQTEMR
jgi:hypothetical protein